MTFTADLGDQFFAALFSQVDREPMEDILDLNALLGVGSLLRFCVVFAYFHLLLYLNFQDCWYYIFELRLSNSSGCHYRVDHQFCTHT